MATASRPARRGTCRRSPARPRRRTRRTAPTGCTAGTARTGRTDAAVGASSGPIVFGALLIWSGLAWLGGVSLETSLAVGLLIIGVGFILGSFVGGSRALIFPALVVGTALAVTAIVDIPLNGPIGTQRWAPQRSTRSQDLYEVSIGEGTLDLSRSTWTG